MIGAELHLGCQRIECDAEEIIDLSGVGQGMASAAAFGRILDDEWPAGWGWDRVGVDTVLHCAEHRS